MEALTRKLPKHLQRYVVPQNYEKYTAVEQATWRFIMRQNRAFFADHAVPVYLQGLKETAIPIDQIPNISVMNQHLSKFGYGAVGVCGFIPPTIFLEFQALGIMPIATDMRTIEHIAYTPAPDIVHEAAGHVPIVVDPAYRHYLSQYGEVAFRAIFSDEDVRLYEAIRYLSDLKENPDTKPGEIALAQQALDLAASSVSFTSESAKVARMGWWTIEYGLVGRLESPKIYGAGLLSSVGESQNCLSDQVRKLPLSLACVDQSYDITEPQPQLFVASSLDQLPGPLAELKATMAFTLGGKNGCQTAIQSKTVNSIQLDSGIEIGGVLVEIEANDSEVDFFRFTGPCQLGFAGSEMTGQGTSQHPHGFSSPLGFWQKHLDQPPHTLSALSLGKLGLIKSERAELRFANGFVISGIVRDIIRGENQSLQLISWHDCTVRRGEKIYFEPSWGCFDMPVGTSVRSVFSGPPDRDAYGSYEIGTASTTPGRVSPYTSYEIGLFDCFHEARKIRKFPAAEDLAVARLHELARVFKERYADEWLLGLELIELQKKFNPAHSHAVSELVFTVQQSLKHREQKESELFLKGLAIAAIAD